MSCLKARPTKLESFYAGCLAAEGWEFDRQICGSGDLFQSCRSATHCARRGGRTARRLREYTSWRCGIHLSMERKSGIRAGTIATYQDFAQMFDEAAGGCGTPPLLRRARVHRSPHRGGIGCVSCLDRGMSWKKNASEKLGRIIFWSVTGERKLPSRSDRDGLQQPLARSVPIYIFLSA